MVVFVLCVVIVTSLVAVNLASYLTKKKDQPQVSPVALSDNTTKQNINNQEEVLKNLIEPISTLDMSSTPPLASTPPKSIVISELTVSNNFNAEKIPDSKIAPHPVTSPQTIQVDSQTSLNTNQAEPEILGLLSDTGETPENQIAEPHSAQVRAMPPKPTKKGAHHPQTARPANETSNLEL